MRVWLGGWQRSYILVLVACFATTSAVGHAQEVPKPAKPEESEAGAKGSETYQEVEKINVGLPDYEEALNLSTPQACVENFVFSAEAGNFQQAARSLNLDLIPTEDQEKRAAELAEQLHSVWQRKVWLDWGQLPDRANGQLDVATGDNPLAGKPRKNIRIALISANGRGVPIRLQRVKAKDSEPIWLFSANTVENIPRLYQEFGPSEFAEMMPTWANTPIGHTPAWQWIALALGIVLACGLAVLTYKLVSRWGHIKADGWTDDLSDAVRVPLACLLATGLLYVLESALSITGPVAWILSPLLLTICIMTIAWLVSRAIDYAMQRVVTRRVRNMDEEDQDDIQRLLTQLSIARRMITLLIVLAGFGILFLQLNTLKILGASLLASAGVMGLVFGFAAKTVLGNVIAGLQIAISRPVRIGDSVVFEGDWGRIEDIGFTYLTVRTWDQRRVVVPTQYFISHPFENWSKRNRHLIKPIHLYVDYETDIEAVREKFIELCKNHEDWDEEAEPSVEVTELTEESMVLRMLCSAEDSSTAWSLHCELREAMVEYVREQRDGQFLPRRRIRMIGQPSLTGNGKSD